MQDQYAALYNLLKEAASRSVSAVFEQFLANEINISQSVRSQASISQNHLREFLNGEATRDDEFPRILKNADSDFFGGSFARHSKIKPLDDIDVYFPIDGHSLVYSRNGVPSPYSVLSDGVLRQNPLIEGGDRWMSGGYLSSKKLINGFASVLNRHYPAQTRIRRSGEAVNVQMSELGFDVVPCFTLHSSIIGTTFYVIPDGADGWIETNPRLDNEISDQLQQNNNKMFRRAVKLVKWWNVNRFASKLPSYYVELAIMRGFRNRNQWGDFVSLVSDAVALGFESLQQAAHAGNLSPWLETAPPIERGELSQVELELLQNVALSARHATNLEQQGDSEEALRFWKVIFGQKLPFEPSE